MIDWFVDSWLRKDIALKIETNRKTVQNAILIELKSIVCIVDPSSQDKRSGDNTILVYISFAVIRVDAYQKSEIYKDRTILNFLFLGTNIKLSSGKTFLDWIYQHTSN